MALLVHGTGNSTTGDGVTSVAIDSTGGKFIAVNVSLGGNTGTLSDNKGNTLVPRTQGVDAFSDRWSQIWDCINPTVGTGHTFTWSGTGNHPALTYAVFDDVVTALDVENNANGGFSSSTNTGIVNPSQASELLIAGLAYDDSVAATIDSSFIVTDANPQTLFGWTGNCMAYKKQTAATSENPTWLWVSGARNVGVIAAYKVAAAGGFTSYNPWPLRAPILAQ